MDRISSSMPCFSDICVTATVKSGVKKRERRKREKEERESGVADESMEMEMDSGCERCEKERDIKETDRET